MKETSVDIGKVYALRSQTGGEVTDENGNILETLEPNVQLRTMAQEQKWLVPDDCKVTKGNFKRALAALFLLGEGGKNLPTSYTRLEYLESTGAVTEQYIITDVCIGDESEVTFSAPYYNDTNRILGAGITNETYSYLVGIDYGGWTFVRLRNYEQTFVYQAKAGHDIKNVVYIGQNEVKLNGNVISAANYKMPAFPSGIRVSLFREMYWDANGAIVPGGAGRRVSRIYGYKGWRDGSLLGNYLPALAPDGVPCMYDTVSGKTFYNAGTGQFTAGLTTVEDVRTLHLPNEGGSLTVSVPATTTEADLTVMHTNNPNWTLTIQIRDYE